MNILHINTNDLRGGAAKVMMRLLQSQQSLGLESNALVGIKESEHSFVYPFDIRKHHKLIQKSKEEGYVNYNTFGAFRLFENPLFQQADVIHLHNMHGDYFNPYAISMLSHIKPIVWTLHDMQSVTGHCSYSYDCSKWMTGCGNCPYPNEYPAIQSDRTHLNWEEKKEIYNNTKLFIVPAAQWIGDIASKGILQGHPMEVVLNGVNIQMYHPMDKQSVRRKYGLPTNKIIIGAVANGGTFGEERKGGKYVQKVIDRLIEAGYDVLLVNVGGAVQGYENDYLYHVGYLSTEEEMAEVYNTFDLYIFPSLADTCPLVISEAMACGIPIVTFDTGGIPEVVKHAETGFVAPQKDEQALYAYTEILITDSDLRKSFGLAARSYCVANFDHELIAGKYIKVYEKAIQVFEHRKDETLYFDLEHVPTVIKNQQLFLHAEQLKGKPLVEEIRKSQTLAVISDDTEDLTKEDVVFVRKDKFHLAENYFKTMLYKTLKTDVLTSGITLVRKSGKPFFQPVLPIRENNHILNTAMGSNFYSRSFFDRNNEAILSGNQIQCNSFELYNTESVSILVNDYMKMIVSEPVYIYGAGTHTIELLKESSFLSGYVTGIIDRNPNLIGTKLLEEYEVIGINDIDDNIPILISSASFEEEIYEQLSQIVKNGLIKIYN
ncbi:glycosyltransferase involved in cell wall biosynthesis [Lysinibacillus parviboronicapiens]|uniref:Glycosyltransferase involved in cell wall biosynthesis n=1 Tax=Lysinibacillus parviboronicapiens TaxID=436516 RepID=A0ABV2PIH5_9BACI